MVFLNFFFDSDKEGHWLPPIERPIAGVGAITSITPAIASAALLVLSQLRLARDGEDVLLAGLAGLVVYLVVSGLAERLSRTRTRTKRRPRRPRGAAREAEGSSGAQAAAAAASRRGEGRPRVLPLPRGARRDVQLRRRDRRVRDLQGHHRDRRRPRPRRALHPDIDRLPRPPGHAGQVPLPRARRALRDRRPRRAAVRQRRGPCSRSDHRHDRRAVIIAAFFSSVAGQPQGGRSRTTGPDPAPASKSATWRRCGHTMGIDYNKRPKKADPRRTRAEPTSEGAERVRAPVSEGRPGQPHQARREGQPEQDQLRRAGPAEPQLEPAAPRAAAGS